MSLSFHLVKKLSGSQGHIQLDVRAEFSAGERICFFGPSGSGKTSILRMLAGLMRPDEGWCRMGNSWWFHAGKHIDLPPQKRKAGLLFQDFALFPNMSVRENLRFAQPQAASEKELEEIMDLLELGELAHRSPSALSGGQKQRVALGRTLLSHPNLLLLDEPLAALDIELRRRLQPVIEKVRSLLAVASILVTHDLFEVLRLADRVLRIDAGRVVADGPPREVLSDLIKTFREETAQLTGPLSHQDPVRGPSEVRSGT